MSAAPIISGITKFPSPAKAGMMNRKIISAAWFVTSPLNVCGLKYCVAGLRQLGPEEQRQEAADEEEDDRRHQVLDADHLVVGVDPEVVLPATRAVPRMVVRHRRPARRIPNPVVEAAEPGQKAERDRHQRDRHDRLRDPRPAASPRSQRIRQTRAVPSSAEQRRHPENPIPARRRPALQPGARRRRRVAARARRGCRAREVGHFVFAARYCTSCVELGRRDRLP